MSNRLAANPGGPPTPARNPAAHRYRFLVATADGDALGGVKALLEGQGCEVLTAGGGVDCLGLLRTFRPDLLVLIPPLLWGSEEGVLEVLAKDAAAPAVPALVVAGAGDPALPPVAFHFFPDPARHPAPLERLVGRVCQWMWYHRPPLRSARPTPG